MKTETVEYLPEGTPVWVQNYRSKPKDGVSPWESGKILNVTFSSRVNAGLNGPVYEVILDRTNDKGFPLRLTVRKDKITTEQPV